MKKTATVVLLLLLGSSFIVNVSAQVGLIPIPSGQIIIDGGLTGDHNVDVVGDIIDCNERAFDSIDHSAADHDIDFCCGGRLFPPPCGTEGQGATGSSIIRTVSTGQVIIPAVQVTTTCDCITEGSESTMGSVTQEAHCDETFHVCGALRTNTFQCEQEQVCDDNCWNTDGERECDFATGHSICEPCDCDCHYLHSQDFDAYCDTSCKCENECDCNGHDDDDECLDPLQDIEDRINAKIDAAIGNILSGAISKCISSALEDCIQI